MAALRSDPPQILTLSEQLDAMLLGWLERQAFCAGWGMTVKRLAETLIRVDGPRLPVVGFAEITSMYRA